MATSFRPILAVGIFMVIVVCRPSIGWGQDNNKSGDIQHEADQLDFAQGLLSRSMYDMAIPQFQKFIAQYPHSVSLEVAYFSLGEAYFLSQDYDKAAEAFAKFGQLYPASGRFPISLLRLGQIDIQLKKYDEALKEFASADPPNKLKGQLLQSFDYYIAQAYLGKSDTAAALDYLQKASQLEGALTAWVLKQTGQLQVSLGHYPEALDAYAKALQAKPEDSLKEELVYRSAEAQFLSGQYADAIRGFGQIAGQNPVSAYSQEAIANLLLANFNLGQYDQLLDAYQKNMKNIRNDGGSFPAHLAAVMADIELEKFDQANSLLDHILSLPGLKPGDRARVFVKKADILVRQDRCKDALALLEAYSSEDIIDADETLFLKARCYFGNGDYDRAFNFFENVYLNFPKSRFAKASLLGQANARQKAGRYKEAETLFLKYNDLQQKPELQRQALFNAAMMAYKSGDAPDAIAMAQKYMKAFPDGPEYGDVLLALAESYGKANQLPQAVQLLQGYLAGPQPPKRPNSANFLLGYDQQVLGNNDQALAAYAKVDQKLEQAKFYADALKNTAIIYMNQKKDDQAGVYFDRLISQAGNDLQVKTYIWVCNEYLMQQKFSDVLRIAADAEKRFPPKDLLEIKYFKAEALRGAGNCDEADTNYQLVTSAKVKNVYTGSAHIGYGLCLAKAGKLGEAQDEIQKSLDENADDSTITLHARFELANIEATRGDLEAALKNYILVATIYEDNTFCPESLLNAAKISEKLDRKADALKLYSEILEKYKNSKAAAYAQERVGLLK